MFADSKALFQPFTCDATPVLMCSTSTRVLEDPPHFIQAHLFIIIFIIFRSKDCHFIFSPWVDSQMVRSYLSLILSIPPSSSFHWGGWDWAVWACFLSSVLCLQFSSSRGSEPSPTGWGDGAMIDRQSERREVLSEWPTISRGILSITLGERPIRDDHKTPLTSTSS